MTPHQMDLDDDKDLPNITIWQILAGVSFVVVTCAIALYALLAGWVSP